MIILKYLDYLLKESQSFVQNYINFQINFKSRLEMQKIKIYPNFYCITQFEIIVRIINFLLMKLSIKEKNGTFIKQLKSENKQYHFQTMNNRLSEFKNEYQIFMKDIQNLNINDYQQELNEANIQYQPTRFVNNLLVQLVNDEKESHLVYIKARLSYFIFELYIYNHGQSSIIQDHLQKIGKGNFSNVYRFQLPGKAEVAIKSIPFLKDSNTQIIKNQLKKIIQEYCISKLASCFRIGPKIITYFGFDFIVFKDSVQFTLELCQKVTSFPIKGMEKQLKHLHNLGIVHRDIKEENIMYSPTYQKNVFIDFNCSSVVRQSIGEKTQTIFKGTLGYITTELKKLLFQDISGYVDLYYNDIFALKQSKNSVRQTLSENIIQLTLHNLQLIVFYSHLTVRYLIFRRNLTKLKIYLEQYSDFLDANEGLKNLIYSRNTSNRQKEQYMNIYSAIIGIIEHTIWISEIVSLNLHARQIRQIIIKKFPQCVSEKSFCLQKSKEQRRKRIDKYLCIQKEISIKTIQHRENKIILEIILPQFFLFPVRIKMINHFLIMSQKADKEQQLVDLYYKFIDSYHPTKQYIKKSVNLFKEKKYVQFKRNDSTLNNMLTIDNHYRRGKRIRYKMKQDLDKIQNQSTQEKEEGNAENQTCRFICNSQVKFRCADLLQMLNKLNQTSQSSENNKALEFFIKGFQSIVQSQKSEQIVPKLNSFQNQISKLIEPLQLNPFLFLINCAKLFTLKKQGSERQKQFEELKQKVITAAQEYQVNEQFYNVIHTPNIFAINMSNLKNIEENLILLANCNFIYQYKYYETMKLLTIIKSIRQNKTEQNQMQTLEQIEKYTTCQHCFLTYLCILLKIAHENDFKDKLIAKSQKYFCTWNITDFGSSTIQKIIRCFNIYFMRFICINKKNYQKYFTRFIDWQRAQHPDGKLPLSHIITRAEMYYYLEQYTSCYQFVVEKIQWHFQRTIITRSQASSLALLCRILKVSSYSFLDKLVQINECEKIIELLEKSQKIFDNSLQNNDFWAINTYYCCLQNFERCFIFWNKYCNQIPQEIGPINGLIFYIKTKNQIFHLFTSALQSKFFFINLILKIQTTLLVDPQYTSPYLVVIVLIVLEILFFYKGKCQVNNTQILFQFIQKSLLFIFKKVLDSPYTISRRVLENIIPMISQFYQLKKKAIHMNTLDEQTIQYLAQKSMTFQQALNFQTKMKVYPLKNYKILLKNLRQSLSRFSAIPFSQLIGNIVKKSNFTRETLRKLVINKFRQYVLIKKSMLNVEDVEGLIIQVKAYYVLYANGDEQSF